MKRLLDVVAAAVLMCSSALVQAPPAAQAQTAKTNGCNHYDSQHVCNQGEITRDAEEAKTILAGGRFTADGSGPPIYVFMSQNCPFSQAFFKDRARFNGVQFRYYPFITPTDNQSQSAQVLMSRSLPEFSGYMDKGLRAPAQPDPAHYQLLKDMDAARSRLDQIMAKNGLYRITTPSWFFIGSEGSLWWTRGYGGPNPVDSIIAYLNPSSVGAPQTSAAASQMPSDVAGIRLGMSMDEVTAAIHAYNPAMKIEKVQSPSQATMIGGQGYPPYTSAIAGYTGAQTISAGEWGDSDGFLVQFTETEGQKAYMISHTITYSKGNAQPQSVLLEKLSAKYGPIPRNWMWTYTPEGKPANVCGGLTGGQFQGIGKYPNQFSFNRGSYYNALSTKFVSPCGVGLSIGMPGTLVRRVDIIFVTGVLLG